QLEKYRVFLRDGGEIRFKTDDDRLFEESLRYFEQSGFSVTRISRDLHRESDIENFVTEHEAQFSSLGVPIKFLIAKKLPEGCVSVSG
ncbi:MAG: tRNA (guanosine(46)-N7)-methyltransferase TrmB, partial [Firmicutes bacterium]|nr:tRNA (guanosine(46)-N7)-methyltransferase TrmB [Bacillota bacterium]